MKQRFNNQFSWAPKQMEEIVEMRKKLRDKKSLLLALKMSEKS
jgi:hypothetical protein